MKQILTLLSFLVVIGITSCQKNDSNNESVTTTIDDLKIPAGFTWENSKDIFFDINITDTRFGTGIFVVSIFDGDPKAGGKLLSKGSASTTAAFTTKIYLPNTVKAVYVVKTAPDNSQTVQKVEITGAKLNVQLSAKSKDLSVKTLMGTSVSGLEDSPNCTTGCTTTITSNTQNLEVNGGQTVCITGNNITVSFVGRGGVIRVCGSNVTMNGGLENNAQLIVTNGATVTFNNFNINGQGSVKNYGTMTVNGSFSPQSLFLNENTISVTGDFNLNSNTDFTNNGVINVGQTMNVNTGTVATNNGAITTNNNFELNGQSVFVNNCSLWVKNNYNHNATMKNYGLIRVNATTTLNGNVELSMYNGAMIQTNDMIMNTKIKGYGTTSLAKVNGNTTINGGGGVVDAMAYCTSQNISTSTFSGGAALSCSTYIPVTNCNTIGNGNAPAADSDNDGVLDSQDEYPNDPTKAYNNYYPSALTSDGATVAFEDKWPQKGDYDMNDVVVSYRYKIVTSAQNKVVQVNGYYTLHATGGEFKNGFGVEFPIPRSSAGTVVGGTLEENQSKAVVLIFSNMRAEMTNWNTRTSETVSPEKTYTISFPVTNGPLLSAFGLGSYNPFIWNGSAARGNEIHLPGKTPTSLANQSLFGTGNDNSSTAAARYYVTATGLPWAINIPTKPFKYPLEQVSIVSGYLKFKDWAESGGTQFADWYSTGTSDYRHNGSLFQP